MKVEVNKLLKLYEKANLELTDIYEITVPAGGCVYGRTTLDGVCGFVLPIKGNAIFRLEGVDYHLEPGVILHAGSEMSLDKEVKGDGEWKFILMHYHVLDEESKYPLEKMHYALSIGKGRSVEVELLVKKLLSLQEENKDMFLKLKSKTMLYSIISCCLHAAKESMTGSKEQSIFYIVDFIQNNLDQALTIQELADKIDMDAKQFHYLFQKSMGLPPKQYIITQRMKRAKELLENEMYTVATIAFMVGYEDPLHFSRIFKKNTGYSPSLYRIEIENNPWRF